MSVAIRNTFAALIAAALTACGPRNADLIEEAYQRLEMHYPQGVQLGWVQAGELSGGERGVCGDAVGIDGALSEDFVFAYDADHARLFIAQGLRSAEFQEVESRCAEAWQS